MDTTLWFEREKEEQQATVRLDFFYDCSPKKNTFKHSRISNEACIKTKLKAKSTDDNCVNGLDLLTKSLLYKMAALQDHKSFRKNIFFPLYPTPVIVRII